MATEEDLKQLKYYINYLSDTISIWNIPEEDIEEEEEIDYEDLKKRIFDLQLNIKCIVESWEE